MGATDMNCNFAWNTGLGVDNTGTACFVGTYSVVIIPQSPAPPLNNAAPSAPSFVWNNRPNALPDPDPELLLGLLLGAPAPASSFTWAGVN
jgi:hypothetical protein